MSRDKDKWTDIRERGRSHFMWTRGALGWGVPTAVFWLIFMWWMHPGFVTARLVLIAAVLFPAGGLAWGWFMWWFMERSHARKSRP